MNATRTLNALFIFAGLTFLSAPAVAESEADGVYSPAVGELRVGTRAPPGETPEPIRYQYAYGETGGSQATELEIIDGIIASLPENSDEPHSIDVFAEGTRSGLRKGETLAARLRTMAKALRPKHGKRVDRIEVLVIPIPEELANADTRAFEKASAGLATDAAEETRFKELLRRAIVKPSARDIRTGAIIGTYRGITSFSTWFATPGISPLLATSIATFQTTLSTFHGIFARSYSNVFNLRLKKTGKPVRSVSYFIRSQIYGILIAEIMRTISGTPHGFAPFDTLAGQAQILTTSLAIGGLDTMLTRTRDAHFFDDPVRFGRICLANFFLLVPWQMLDSVGTFPVLLDLTIYKIRASTLGMLTTYFALYQSITRAPEKTGLVLDAVFEPAERIGGQVVGSIRRAFGQTCKSLFDSAENFGDAFRRLRQ